MIMNDDNIFNEMDGIREMIEKKIGKTIIFEWWNFENGKRGSEMGFVMEDGNLMMVEINILDKAN